MEEKLEIRETGVKDLENIRKLWADVDVMKFVGFPNGLIYSHEDIKKWYEKIEKNRPMTNHYSIYFDGEYCGETYYSIDKFYMTASMDIKLFKEKRSKGIASLSLSYAIKKAFQEGAKLCWVDPNPENLNAINLYEKLGFVKKDLPIWVKKYPKQIYYEISKDDVNFS